MNFKLTFDQNNEIFLFIKNQWAVVFVYVMNLVVTNNL